MRILDSLPGNCCVSRYAFKIIEFLQLQDDLVE